MEAVAQLTKLQFLNLEHAGQQSTDLQQSPFAVETVICMFPKRLAIVLDCVVHGTWVCVVLWCSQRALKLHACTAIRRELLLPCGS